MADHLILWGFSEGLFRVKNALNGGRVGADKQDQQHQLQKLRNKSPYDQKKDSFGSSEHTNTAILDKIFPLLIGLELKNDAVV